METTMAHFVSLLLAALLYVTGSDLASAVGKCTSISAQCAVEIGGGVIQKRAIGNMEIAETVGPAAQIVAVHSMAVCRESLKSRRSRSGCPYGRGFCDPTKKGAACPKTAAQNLAGLGMGGKGRQSAF
jgi:hypothetical protein